MSKHNIVEDDNVASYIALALNSPGLAAFFNKSSPYDIAYQD